MHACYSHEMLVYYPLGTMSLMNESTTSSLETCFKLVLLFVTFYCHFAESYKIVQLNYLHSDREKLSF